VEFDGVGFSAGGLMGYAYEVGVARGLDLQSQCCKHLHHAGASAGALTAASVKAGLQPHECLDGCKHMCQSLAKNGTPGRLRVELSAVLHDMLPNESHIACTPDVHLALTRVHVSNRRVSLEPQLISSFVSREDLIECLLASCHIPLYFDRFTLTTTSFRNTRYLDGGLLNFLPSPPGCDNPVRVNCFPVMQQLQITTSGTPGDGLSYLSNNEPNSDQPRTSEKRTDSSVAASSDDSSSEQSGESQSGAFKQQWDRNRDFQERYQARRRQQLSWLHADIAPDLRITESISRPGTSTFTLGEALRMALLPPSDEELERLFERGAADAEYFLQQRQRQGAGHTTRASSIK
jgi:predicted acylesterase/phospholipase RssA